MALQPESIFALRDDGDLRARAYDDDYKATKEAIKELFDTKVMQYTDLSIIKQLYKYAFLNRNSLEKVLATSLKPKLQKPKYTSNIDLLYHNGAIIKYEYGNQNDYITFYGLSAGSYDYMKTYYNRVAVTHHPVKDPYEIETTYPVSRILERLSLNQWHINLLTSYTGAIQEEGYFQKKRYYRTKAYLPSFFRIKGSEEKFSVFSIPYPKDKRDLEQFGRRLLKVGEMMQRNGNHHATIVILCESIRQIERAYYVLWSIIELRSIHPVFAIDLHTAHSNGLEWLYEMKQNAKGVTNLDTIDFHVFD